MTRIEIVVVALPPVLVAVTVYVVEEETAVGVPLISPVDVLNVKPAGLSLNATTGEISGTPTAVTPLTNYTITASNAGGSNSTTFTLQVNDVVPTIEYLPNDLSMTNNTASSDLPLTPTITGAGTIVSWTVSPSLPSGLAIDVATGEIDHEVTAPPLDVGVMVVRATFLVSVIELGL